MFCTKTFFRMLANTSFNIAYLGNFKIFFSNQHVIRPQVPLDSCSGGDGGLPPILGGFLTPPWHFF
jgi:hypothetical protein